MEPPDLVSEPAPLMMGGIPIASYTLTIAFSLLHRTAISGRRPGVGPTECIGDPAQVRSRRDRSVDASLYFLTGCG